MYVSANVCFFEIGILNPCFNDGGCGRVDSIFGIKISGEFFEILYVLLVFPIRAIKIDLPLITFLGIQKYKPSISAWRFSGYIAAIGYIIALVIFDRGDCALLGVAAFLAWSASNFSLKKNSIKIIAAEINKNRDI